MDKKAKGERLKEMPKAETVQGSRGRLDFHSLICFSL
jgi:hypothetical protein